MMSPMKLSMMMTGYDAPIGNCEDNDDMVDKEEEEEELEHDATYGVLDEADDWLW